jgi:hypothetical protein
MGRLFRRVVRTARRTRRASRGSTVRSADGRQYRVVAVNETEDTEFADPPRKWGRVGLMAGAWAIALSLGAWVAPGFAASGNPDNVDPRDEPATDASGAALRYIRYGSNEDIDRADAALCQDASPELTPAEIDGIRQAFDEELGGITRTDFDAGEPSPVAGGTQFTITAAYIYQAQQQYQDFVVTVVEADGTYCVSDAALPEGDEPDAGDRTEEPVDPKATARDLMQAVVLDRDPAAAAEFQCPPESYIGITPEALDAAITEWASANGPTEGAIDTINPTESSESSVTAFDFKITLKGELIRESFIFTVGVQGNCVALLEDVDGLI